MEQLHGRCRLACDKAKALVSHGMPEHLRADAQQCIGDMEELLSASTAAPAADSRDQLMLLTCSAVDFACLGMDVAIDLSKRVDALEGNEELLVLREAASQCENKLCRLCLKEPMSAKDVRYGSLARLKKDKRLDRPLLEQYLGTWQGMEDGLEALKSLGGLNAAHPRQTAPPTKEELLSLVEKHTGRFVRPAILEVIEVLVDAAEKLKEPLFVPTM
jgi:hypothetical protein